MQRRGKTRRGNETDLDDQCRLVAAGDVLAFGEHIPHAGNNQDPDAGQATRLNARAATFVVSRPSARKAGHQDGQRELPADSDRCCQHMEKHPDRVPADGQHGHSQSAKRNVPVAPAPVGADGTHPMLSLGRSVAAAGSDVDMAIERCSGESGLAATLRI